MDSLGFKWITLPLVGLVDMSEHGSSSGWEDVVPSCSETKSQTVCKGCKHFLPKWEVHKLCAGCRPAPLCSPITKTSCAACQAAPDSFWAENHRHMVKRLEATRIHHAKAAPRVKKEPTSVKGFRAKEAALARSRLMCRLLLATQLVSTDASDVNPASECPVPPRIVIEGNDQALMSLLADPSNVSGNNLPLASGTSPVVFKVPEAIGHASQVYVSAQANITTSLTSGVVPPSATAGAGTMAGAAFSPVTLVNLQTPRPRPSATATATAPRMSPPVSAPPGGYGHPIQGTFHGSGLPSPSVYGFGFPQGYGPTAADLQGQAPSPSHYSAWMYNQPHMGGVFTGPAPYGTAAAQFGTGPAQYGTGGAQFPTGFPHSFGSTGNSQYGTGPYGYGSLQGQWPSWQQQGMSQQPWDINSRSSMASPPVSAGVQDTAASSVASQMPPPLVTTVTRVAPQPTPPLSVFSGFSTAATSTSNVSSFVTSSQGQMDFSTILTTASPSGPSAPKRPRVDNRQDCYSDVSGEEEDDVLEEFSSSQSTMDKEDLDTSLSFQSKVNLVKEVLHEFVVDMLPSPPPVKKSNLLSAVWTQPVIAPEVTVLPLSPDVRAGLTDIRDDIRKQQPLKPGKGSASSRGPRKPKTLPRWYESFSPDFPKAPPSLSESFLRHTKSGKVPQSVSCSWDQVVSLESALRSSIQISSMATWFVAASTRLLQKLSSDLTDSEVSDTALPQIKNIQELLQSVGRCLDDRSPLDSFGLWSLVLLRRDAALRDLKFSPPTQLRTDLRTSPLSACPDATPTSEGSPQYLFGEVPVKLASEAKEITQNKMNEAVLSAARLGRSSSAPARPQTAAKKRSLKGEGQRQSTPRFRQPFSGTPPATAPAPRGQQRPYRPAGGPRQRGPRPQKRSA